MTARVVVVTGGAAGIGAAIAHRFVSDGDHVVVADVNDDSAHGLIAELGPRASFVHTDMSSDPAVQNLIEQVMSAHGGLDVMCNNAGVLGSSAGLLDLAIADYETAFSTNVLGTLLGIKHAAAAMIEVGRGGAIVNTASVAGLRGGVGPILYTAAKHAIVGLTRSAASELARHRIRVNAVAPGVVPTAMAAENITGDRSQVAEVRELLDRRAPFGRASTPDDIAGVVAFLAGNDSAYLTGEVLLADGGATMANPKRQA